MNCRACANEISNGSQFCNRCGTSTNPVEKKSKRGIILSCVGVGVALVVLLLYFTRAGAVVVHSPVAYANTTQNVAAHSWRSIVFEAPYAGTLDITAQVVHGNPVDVYLVDESLMEVMKRTPNWRAIQGNTNFSAVKTTTYHRTAPVKQGRYYLVLRDTSLGIFSASATDVDLKMNLNP